jgi:16S rRNA (uracil1498-N3)-methyltransferase
MHDYRLYVPPEKITGETARLDGDEFHHCTAVLRRSAGPITVFDGVAREWQATITAVERRHAMLHLDRLVREAAQRGVRIVACPALLKGKSFDAVIEAATELGAHAIAPVVAARCAPRASTGDVDARVARWRRISIAAAKQSGRIALPEIRVPAPLDEVLASLASARLLICAAHGAAQPLLRVLEQAPPGAAAIAVLVGPEADFTPEELAAAVEAGAHVAQLGPTTLRAATAAAYALSVVSAYLAAHRRGSD